MAFDTHLDQRLANALKNQPAIERKKMFGGTVYMLNGNMCVGVHKEFLILRVGDEGAMQLLSRPYVRPMDITGKAMKGWVMVQPEGYAMENDLNTFVSHAVAFVSMLPPKK